MTTVVFEESFPRLIVDFLRGFETLPPDRNVLFGSFLSFLLKRVEDINTLVKLSHIENTKSVAGLNSDLVGTRADRGHGFEIAWFVPSLNGS